MQRSGLKPPKRRNRGLSDASSWGLRRVALMGGGLLVLGGAVYGLAATEYSAWASARVMDRAITLSANMGYRVDKVDVEGRVNMPLSALKPKVQVARGDPLFGVDLGALRAGLVADPWIKEASVQRHLPSRIYIALTERTPIALWQKTGKVQVIDSEGRALTSDLRGFTSLPLVVGDGAERGAADLIAQLAAEPAIFQKMEAAQWISNRRWDLLLKNKMVIKLPDENMGLALRRLADGDRSDQILTKDISEIDLRQPDRMILSPRTGKSHDFTPTPSPAQSTTP